MVWMVKGLEVGRPEISIDAIYIKLVQVSPNLIILRVFYSLHSIDRGDAVAMGDFPKDRLHRAPNGKDSELREVHPARLSLHRPSPPFIESATASDSTRGLGHGRAVEQLRVASDRDATALPIFVSSAPFKRGLRPSSVFEQVLSAGMGMVPIIDYDCNSGNSNKVRLGYI
ncbi:hypothetical protein PRIPAC_84505 [Pristionchus pacificus]|uniref:Uncharacterized protein n=1 Tax=Pristionchus pacificus TaxID=54126 RepID=A0A2A6BGX1_PRIPA|nr:hypothetical protein PRIPAC_84505 [Pristionchus pacificus]|eukprot:PDM65103.1 hypothetical protein PRIPAC_53352 [Pristionchus pacificus]